MIADPSSDWMKAAVPLVFAEDLATSRHLVPVIAGNESGAYQAGASEMLEATVEERRGRVRVEAFIRDMKTQRNRRVIEARGPAAGGLIATVNEIARKIDARATDYSTSNGAALRAFSAAAETSDAKAQMQDLNRAIALDPGFGVAYITALDVLARTGAQNLPAVLAKAHAHEEAFTPLDRARFEEIASRVSHVPLKRRASAASALLRLAPNNLDALTSLAADRFLQGDAKAVALLRRASQVSPGDAGIRLDRAEGLLETKQFRKAEKIFVRLDSDPDVLPD
ncbi:MAG: hypothetical protein ACRD4O_09990, partial [Bryobacteraceae bacterium]